MKFMIIENDLELVKKYDSIGVDRIFVDLEILGKQDRQGHLDTVISNHTVEDVDKISKVLTTSELIVRINPINDNSKEEIDKVIEYGADVIMLPMFKSKEEVKTFISIVDKRVKTCLLLETAQALCRLDDILELGGINEVHIGLNDLHLSMGLDFMFELVSGGIIEYLSHKVIDKGIVFGFGGIATLDKGLISGEMVLKEHVRINSSMVILSRAFKQIAEKDILTFDKEFKMLKQAANKFTKLSQEELEFNKEKFKLSVHEIVTGDNDYV